MYRLGLAERLGRTLAELDNTLGSWELELWKARDEIDQRVESRRNRAKGLTYGQALDLVRADFRSYLNAKGKR